MGVNLLHGETNDHFAEEEILVGETLSDSALGLTHMIVNKNV